MSRGFGVNHEWGKLHEAVVGKMPALAEALMAAGVTVRSCNSIAEPRDPLIVIGHHLIEASLRFESRAAERFALRPIAQDTAQRPGVAWSCAPPGWTNGVDGPFLEGGDVLVNGREVYVGMSGRASDMAGIDWLERLLGPTIRVIPVAMRSSVRHLEDILALVRPGLLVCCPELLIDGLPMSLRSWQAVSLSPREVEAGGAHLLVLGTDRVVLDAGNGRMAELLERQRIEAIVGAFGSRLRAAHLPLWRESVVE